MNGSENDNKKIFNLLVNDIPEKFTGKLEVKSAEQTWIIFFCLGHLVWANGGKHNNRRFQRIWKQLCPHISLENIKLRETESFNCYYYHAISVLSRRKLLTSIQTKKIIFWHLNEVLFDILQQESQEKLTYNLSKQGLEKSLILMSAVIRIETVITPVNKLWQEWQTSNLTEYSPNLFPVIVKPKTLQKVAKNNSYQTITKLVNGQNTLREMAVLFKKDLRQLTLFLMPYIRNKLIGLKEVPDKKRIEGTAQLQTDFSIVETAQQTQALIACVDDSKEICYLLEKIMNQGGYKFLGIQDSIKALPIIIEAKPDLIFLDLMMPIANGYEICTQLRRAPMFENTPIVILTGNDGVVDRVRAKMVGATGYMTKPIEAKKVLDLVKQYLHNPPPPNFEVTQN